MIKVKMFSFTSYKWVLVMTHVDDDFEYVILELNLNYRKMFRYPHTIYNFDFVEKMYDYVEW